MKRNKLVVALAIAAGIFTQAAPAQMTREQVVETILKNNHRLQQIAAQQSSTLLSESDEATSLGETELEFEHLWGGDDAKKWNVGVTQSFDWPGAYGKRKAAVAAKGEAFRFLYEAESLDIAQQAKEAVTAGVFANQKLSLLKAVEKNLKQLQEYIKTGYEKGQLTILDVKKINLELFTLATQISDAEQEASAFKAELTGLNGGNDIDAFTEDYYPEQFRSLEDYLALARDNNPVVNAATQDATAARIGSQAARLSRMPGFSVGYRHAFEEETHFNGFAVGVSLPLFSKRKASKAALLEAESFNFAASEAVAQSQATTRALFEDASKRRSLLEGLSEKTLDNSYPDLLLMAYKGGQINVITYLQELNYFLSARQDYLAAVYAYQLDLVRLNKYN